MTNESFGLLVITIISFLFLFGTGSIVLSCLLDTKENNSPSYKIDDNTVNSAHIIITDFEEDSIFNNT